MPPYTILIVDDESYIRDLLVSVLSLEYSVLTAEDGVEAFEAYRQHQDVIRCVITDLFMPRMDGEELIGRLHGENPDLPVILITALQDEARLNQLRERPNVTVMPKPFNLGQLRNTLRQSTVAQ
ncbi:MAG: response regulator [Chloracidobacterium sp.]|uniref:Response regulator n=1 Tax=Chloracidobacterium validum TaxID=2821543 RepID=A0ABX8BAH1_9BACT|nr:response regulator [Chloracidobacterium validum]QUW03664.1 response regulator [Chloracidobacterium validum]